MWHGRREKGALSYTSTEDSATRQWRLPCPGAAHRKEYEGFFFKKLQEDPSFEGQLGPNTVSLLVLERP